MAPTKEESNGRKRVTSGEESFEELREGILKEIKCNYDTRLKEETERFSSSGKPLTPSMISDVSAKFQQTFSTYLTTAFDIVFSNDLISSTSIHKEAEKLSENKKNSDEHNSSVTNEQLQGMDNLVTEVARRRKTYPKKCTHFLEKTLEYKAKAAERIRVNVNNVEALEEDDLEEKSDNHELQGKLEELQSSVRKQIQKSVRIENAFRMLDEPMLTE